MDVYLAVASKRDGRVYAERAIPPASEARILDAGRLSGSARNGQPWTFTVADSPAAKEAVATSVYRPELVLTAALVVVITVLRVGRLYDFDAGRAAQNMMLTAWDDGVVSCPNGIARPGALLGPLGLSDDQRPVTVLSFGYPANARPAKRWPPESWSARARRRPFEQVVRRL
ncbi:MAG: nitroreductase family protein [Thermoleophilia bacterium]|nr:nitroreductase family protein [Thermoleophilia bacterium]MDH3725701.1 nitroreductase family protein [Thermoleophilia bacterium]